jgi:hypothetical protein
VRIRLLIFLVVAQCAATTMPIRAGSLRHLEYAVSSTVDGRAQQGTIRLDLRAVGADRGFDIALEDDRGSAGNSAFEVNLARSGAMRLNGAGELRSEEEALVYFFGLSHENMTGVDPGDHWMRENATADGTQVTRYTVLHADGELVDLSVTRALSQRDGSTETWQAT